MEKYFLVRTEDVEIFSEWLLRKRIKFSVATANDSWKIFSVNIEFRKKFSKEEIIALWGNGEKTQAEVAKLVGCSASYVQKVLSEN